MKRTTLESLSDGECIFSNGTDVLVAGKYLRLFRADGTFVTKFAPIRRPRRVAMLPGRTALVEGAADKAYHYLSLEEGRILWTCPQKGHSPWTAPTALPCPRMALPPMFCTTHSLRPWRQNKSVP